MIMRPSLRKLALTSHVTASVGWVGAVVVFLGMALVGLTHEDARAVRGVYLVMDVIARIVLLPLAIASLVSGLIQSLGTTWGLLRHYWVVFKLVITLFATAILIVYMGTFRQMASAAADATIDLAVVRNPSPVVHAVLALLALLVATVLAIYKPKGLTAYGRRTEREGSVVALHE
jgi:hypothetical protein